MKPTIKQWLLDGVQYDENGAMIWAKNNTTDEIRHVIDIRGFGSMLKTFKLDEAEAMRFQDDLGRFLADAINEKLSTTP